VRGAAEVGSGASRDGDRLSILVWHYHDDDLPGPAAAVALDLRGLPPALSRGAVLTHYRIDDAHSNSFTAWQAMGAPLAPTNAQRAALLRAAELVTIDPGPTPFATDHGRTTLRFTLPRRGVSLLVLSPKPDQPAERGG
ncbi:beta-xylosidase, partial [Sphingomonas sp. S-NIH.Pt15_0812]